MKSKTIKKLQLEVLLLGMLVFSFGKVSAAKAAPTVGNVLQKTDSFADLVWSFLKWSEVILLAPFVLGWVFANLLRRSNERKGRVATKETKELFKVLDVGLVFAVLYHLALLAFSSYRDGLDYAYSEYYTTCFIYISLISIAVIYLWIFLHFSRHRSISRKNEKSAAKK